MKPICHLLLLLLALALAACHSAPAAAPSPAPLPLDQLQPPPQLGQWHLQGSIGQDEKVHVARYQQDTNAKQLLDISLYPLPDGWQQFTPAQALERHFGMLAQQLANDVTNKYQARQVDVSGTQVQAASATSPALIDSRFISHFADGSTRITLVSLTIYKGNFVRLTLTTDSDQADALATSLDASRHALLLHFDETTGDVLPAHG